MAGRFDEAECLAMETFDLGRKVNEQAAAQILGIFMFVLRWLQGRLAEIDDMFQSQVEQFGMAPSYRAANAFLHLTLGRNEQAREELDRLATNDFADLPETWLTLNMLRSLSEVAAALGDKRRAALLYDRWRPYADRLLMIGARIACFGATTHWLGLLAGTMRRWDDAVAHFEAALETNARIGARPFLARTQHEYARMLIERNAPGDKEKARTLLTEATATYRELGMPSFLENAEELLKSV
jgi:tetratricopeptide (TPR) repeat protein